MVWGVQFTIVRSVQFRVSLIPYGALYPLVSKISYFTLLQFAQLAKISSDYCISKGDSLVMLCVTLNLPENCIEGMSVCGVVILLHVNSTS